MAVNAKKVRLQDGSTRDIEDAAARESIKVLEEKGREIERLAQGVSEAKALANQAKASANSASTAAGEAKTAAQTANSNASEAKTKADQAKTSADQANERVGLIAPLSYKLEYVLTEDTTAQINKFYYTTDGYGTFTENRRTPVRDKDGKILYYQNAPFEAGVAYYEIKKGTVTLPQVKVDSGGYPLTGSWDPDKYVSSAGIEIGHHARALPESDGFNWNIAIGQNSTAGDGDAGDQCCAIGEQSKATKYAGTAIGSKAASTADGATAIGWGCSVAARYGFAMGRGAKIPEGADCAIQIGPGSNDSPGTTQIGTADLKFTPIPNGSIATPNTSYYKNVDGKYLRVNFSEGQLIPNSPQIYTLSYGTIKTYRLLELDGTIPIERFNIAALKKALGL